MSNDPQGPGRALRLVSGLCSMAGTLILAAVLLSCLPVTVPRLLGYAVYNVVSGSMEPEIPVGSIAFVKEAPPEEIREGDVIAFYREDSTVIHRVTDVSPERREFITKGDANAGEDFDAVPYDAVIGRVERHFPGIGQVMVLYTSGIGKISLICFAACGVALNLLANQIRSGRKESAGSGGKNT